MWASLCMWCVSENGYPSSHSSAVAMFPAGWIFARIRDPNMNHNAGQSLPRINTSLPKEGRQRKIIFIIPRERWGVEQLNDFFRATQEMPPDSNDPHSVGWSPVFAAVWNALPTK